MLVIGTIIYVIIGLVVTAALLTDKQTCTSYKDGVLICAAGTIWPITIGVAASFALYGNLQEKYVARKAAKKERIIYFSAKLMKMRLISMDAHQRLVRELNK